MLSKDNSLQICILGRREEQEIADKLAPYSENMHYYTCDICNKSQLVSVMELIQKKFGAVHGFINSSGVCGDQYLIDREPEHLLKTEILAPKVEGMEN